MLFDLKVSGFVDVTAKTAKEMRRWVDAFDAAVFVVAGDILSELLPGVPRKSGELQESRAVPRTAPTEIVFGARHAAVTHELGPHKKWLQRPVAAAAGTVRGRVAALLPRRATAGTTLATAPTKHPTTPKTTSTARRRPTAPPRRR